MGTFSISIKDFINKRIVGKLYFFKAMLHLTNNASRSSCMWPISMKITYTSQKIIFATSRDQKQKTNLFLLSLVALSICIFNIGGKGKVGTRCSGGVGRDDIHIPAFYKSASYKAIVLDSTNNWRYDEFGGNTRSRRSFVNDPIV